MGMPAIRLWLERVLPKLGVVLLLTSVGTAYANSGGIAGYSGKQGPTCTSCHTASAFNITTAVTGPTQVAPGAADIAFGIGTTAGTANAFGFNLSATAGTLSPGAGSRLTTVDLDGIDGELTHSSPQDPTPSSASAGGPASWSFRFDAPLSVGTVTLYGCVNPVNQGGTEEGDGPARCATRSVTVNTAPNAGNDTASVLEDAAATCISVLSGDTSGTSGNESGDAITLFSVGTPSQGGTATVGGGSCQANQVRYTPAANFFGTETFTYTIRDSFNSATFQSSATVTVTVAAVNDAPTLAAIANPAAIAEDAPQQTIALSGIGPGPANESAQSVVITARSSNPALVPNPQVVYVAGQSTGSLTYTPVANLSGSALITVTITDNGGTLNGGIDTRERTFTVVVSGVDDAPVASPDSFPVPPAVLLEDSFAVLLDVLANDIDDDAGDTKTISAVTQGSSGGIVAIVGTGPDNQVSYTPAANFYGEENFTYTVRDSTNRTDVGTVTVTVSPVNDPPAIPSSGPATVNDATVFRYAVQVADVDDDSFTYALGGAVPTSGTPMQITASGGVITWTPPISPTLEPYTVGPITVTVTDEGGGAGAAEKGSVTQTFSVTVLAPDSDGDGMPDSYERARGFDPQDPADGAADRDGDGRSNRQEYEAGTDPDRDDVPPMLTVPPTRQVASTGFLTAVDLGLAGARDVKDGVLAAPVPNPSGPFRPGRYLIEYAVDDAAGNRAVATQQLDLLPRVELGPDQVSGEGRRIEVPLILNGPAPSYPVTVTYRVSGTSGPADHDAVDGSLSIAAGTTVSIPVNIAADGAGEPDETLIITLTSASGAMLGGRTSQLTRITESNLPPSVSLSVSQLGEPRSQVFGNQGRVTVQAVVRDPNAGDVVTYDFSGTDAALAPPAGNVAGFGFDPAALAPGLYRVRVTARDGAGAASQVDLSLSVASSAPVLGMLDSDGDGLADASEGLADRDGDGVPDYLDRFESRFAVADQGVAPSSTRMLETESGLGLRLGPTALAAARSGAAVAAADIRGAASNDAGYQNVGGLFDFEVYGLSRGATASVVLPLQAGLQPGAVWRKYVADAGWREFVVDERNRVASAPAVGGQCPAPASPAYVPGLTPLHRCVRLSLEDGGPNDADGEPNGRILDPGGAAVPVRAEPSAPAGGKSGGGVVTPPLLLGLGALALFSLVRRRRRIA